MARSPSGSAPSAVDRCCSSRGSLPLRSSSVLHPSWLLVPRETTVHTAKTLRVSARSASQRLLAEQALFPQLGMPSNRSHLPLPSTSQQLAPSSAICAHCSSAPRDDASTPLKSHKVRVRRKRVRLPSSRCIESAPARFAPAFFFRRRALPIHL